MRAASAWVRRVKAWPAGSRSIVHSETQDDPFRAPTASALRAAIVAPSRRTLVRECAVRDRTGVGGSSRPIAIDCYYEPADSMHTRYWATPESHIIIDLSDASLRDAIVRSFDERACFRFGSQAWIAFAEYTRYYDVSFSPLDRTATSTVPAHFPVTDSVSSLLFCVRTKDLMEFLEMSRKLWSSSKWMQQFRDAYGLYLEDKLEDGLAEMLRECQSDSYTPNSLVALTD